MRALITLKHPDRDVFYNFLPHLIKNIPIGMEVLDGLPPNKGLRSLFVSPNIRNLSRVNNQADVAQLVEQLIRNQ